MRKLLIASVIFLFVLLNIKPIDKYTSVALEVEERNNLKTYELKLNLNYLEINSLLTLYYEEIFIYPKMSNLIKIKLSDYRFKLIKHNLDYQLRRFYDLYLNKLKSNSFFNEIEKIKIHGLIIEKIVILTLEDEFNMWIKNHPDIKYHVIE